MKDNLVEEPYEICYNAFCNAFIYAAECQCQFL